MYIKLNMVIVVNVLDCDYYLTLNNINDTDINSRINQFAKNIFFIKTTS